MEEMERELPILGENQVDTRSRSKADTFWKSVLQDFWKECILYFFPEAGDYLDFSKTPEFIDKELQAIFPNHGGDSRRTYADLLIKVPLSDIPDQSAILHFEVHDYYYRTLGEVMFRRFRRLSDKYEGCPVAAIVMVTKQGLRVPEFYEQQFLSTSVRYSYSVYNIYEVEEEDLVKSDSPVAFLILIARQASLKKKFSDDMLLNDKIRILEYISNKNFSPFQKQRLGNFLVCYVPFRNPAMTKVFWKNVKKNKKIHGTMGILELSLQIAEERGVEQGIEIGMSKGLEQGVEIGVSKGMEQGIEIGMSKGLEQGMSKGMEQGIEKGARKYQEESILKLYRNLDLAAEKIAAALEIPLDTVVEVLRNNDK